MILTNKPYFFPAIAIALFIAMSQFSHAGGPSYFDTVLNDGPLAYWTFDETDPSQTAVNHGLLGTVADGTYELNGVQLVTDSLVNNSPGGSMFLSGSGRMATAPFEKFAQDPVFGIGGTGYSVEFWTDLATLPSGFTNLVGDGESGGDFNLMVYTGSSPAPAGFIRPHANTDGSGVSAIDSQSRLAAGKIVHVVSTWDSTTGDMTLYLDGQVADIGGSLAAGTPTTGAAINTDNPIYIGRDGREPRTPNGWLDEVAIYNFPLTSSQVASHYGVGQGAIPPMLPPLPPAPPNVNVSLSTDVMGPGTVGNGHSTESGTVDIVRQIANSAAANIVPYTSDNAGPTIDVAPWIVDGGTAGGFGSNEHGRGGNLFIIGDGEGNTPHEGFGGHANWIITFDLDDVRSHNMGAANGDLRLTGSYGSWGAIGDPTAPAGITQGLVFVDGVRVDNMAETTHNVPTSGGVDSPSQAFDIIVPNGARHLTLGILSGPGSTFWDDGNFRNVRLRVADPVLDSQVGLVSYYPFDEASTGTADAQDQPGGNLGTFESTATRSVGIVGNGAARFNNTGGNAVNIGNGDDGNLAMSEGITIEAMVISEWSGAAGDYDEVFRKEDGGNRILFSFQNDVHGGGANPPVDPGPVLSFGLNVNGYGELDLPLDGLDGRPALSDLTDGIPHHLVATYDSATGEKAIYIDGEKRWSVDLGAGSLLVSGGASMATIGNVGPGGGEPFSGIIDEVAIWSRALSADEIGNHFANVVSGNNYFVPEPGSMALVLLGIVGLSCLRRRRS